MTKIKFNIFFMLILILCVSCVTKNRDTFNMLSMSKFYYDSAMKEVVTQYKLGNVSEEQKTSIIKVGNQFVMDYENAVGVLSNKNCSNNLKNKMMDDFIKSQIKFNNVVSEVLND